MVFLALPLQNFEIFSDKSKFQGPVMSRESVADC